MKYLVFDFEHTDGVYRPWGDNFIISCIGFQQYNDTFLINQGVLWFNHKNIDFVPPATIDSWKMFQSLVDDSDVIVGHNLKHDLLLATYYGINFEGKKLWCTQVAEYLICGQDQDLSYSLNETAKRKGVKGKIDAAGLFWANGTHTYDIPYDILHQYVVQDVQATSDVMFMQIAETKEDKVLKVIELQNEFIFSLVDMELAGLKIDMAKGKELYEHEVKVIADLEYSLKELIGEQRLNLQSNDHLSAALYGGVAVIKRKEWVTKTYKTKPETKYYEKEFEETIELPRIFTPLPKTEAKKKGYWRTDKDTVAQLKSKNSKCRKIKKILAQLSVHFKIAESIFGKTDNSGLLNKVSLDGCIHTSFYNTFTSTGRLSSRNPNGQNFPREGTSPIKQMIVPRFNFIGQVDLSQIEWRDAAWQSQDRMMIHEINSGIDQHIVACTDLMGLPFISKEDPESKANRNHAKIFNFRMIYGGSFWGFYLDRKMPSFSKGKWKTICDDFYRKYSNLKEWQSKNIEYVIAHDGWLQIPTGRKFRFKKVEYKDGVPWYSETQIKNYPIQGNSGGNILPLLCVVLRRGFKAMGLKSLMILTVHDSIVFDIVEEELAKITKLCRMVLDNLDQYISNFFDVDWNVKLAGEFELGINYGELKPHEM